jgi:hypothetical protein
VSSRPALRRNQRPGRETDHSPPTSAEIRKTWASTSTFPYAFLAWCLITETSLHYNSVLVCWFSNLWVGGWHNNNNNNKYKKERLSQCLTNAMKTWGIGCTNPRILDLGISWKWVASFMPRALYPPSPSFLWIEGWMGPRTGLDNVERWNIFSPTGTQTPNPRSSIP